MTEAQYLELRDRLFARGFWPEYDWAQNVQPPADAKQFACECIWVILNSGLKNQVAEMIAGRLWPVLKRGGSAREVFGHLGKASAIDEIWTGRETYFAAYMLIPDNPEAKRTYLRTLPWIGPVTCWHLAKNLGIDCAKPDRWLVRVAEASGETVDGLCARIAMATGDRVATVDLIIWRGCNLGLVAIVGGNVEVLGRAA